MFSVLGFQTQQANRCAAKLRSCEPFPVSQLAYPVFQVIDGLPAVEQPAVPYVGPWAAWCEVASDAAEAAAAGGGKQYYGLAAELAAFQEGADKPWRSVPPDGKPR